MKTKAPKSAPAAAEATPLAMPQTASSAGSAFHALLDRQVRTQGLPQPVKAEGIAIGTLIDVSTDRSLIQVYIPSLNLGPMPAVSMVALGPQHIGQSLALGFEGADAHRPVVLGLMMLPTASMQPEPAQPQGEVTENAIQVSQNGHRVVVQAQTELELRCGEAVILLSADGSIQIRGAYVTSHASASNRIRGGSVQIN